MNDPIAIVFAIVSGLALVGGVAIVAHVLFAADYTVDDVSDSELQSRIDAAFEEEKQS